MTEAATKIRVTQPGIYGAKGAIPVGTEFPVTGAIPPGWKDKCVALSEVAEAAEPVTNPAPVSEVLEDLQTMTKEQMMEFAKDNSIEVDGRWNYDKLREVLVNTVQATQTGV